MYSMSSLRGAAAHRYACRSSTCSRGACREMSAKIYRELAWKRRHLPQHFQECVGRQSFVETAVPAWSKNCFTRA